jgi:hypothetical protein
VVERSAAASAPAAPRGLALVRATERPQSLWNAMGLAIALALGLLWEWSPHRVAEDRYTGGIAWFFATMLGYYVAAIPFAMRGALRDAASLPALDPASRAALAARLARPPAALVAATLAAGIATHVGVLFGTDYPFRDLLDASAVLSAFGLISLLGWAHILVFSCGVALLLWHGAIFRRTGRELPEVDLLDHGPLAPFVRVALRETLLFVVWVACALLFHVDWSGDHTLAPQILWVTPVWASIALVLFATPLWGIHQQLRSERDAELRRAAAAIRGERSALRDSLVAHDAERLHAVDLLAYRARIAELGTWPFDASTLLRLALYLGIPLLGWVGGALVERGLDALLG